MPLQSAEEGRDEKKFPTKRRNQKIHLPSRFALTRRWKTILAVLLVGIASFSIGAYANRVTVQQVQSIAGNHVIVPAPELQVLNTIWNIELNSSQVTGLILNVTTTGVSGQTGSKLYHIDVQVSCLTATATTPNCAFGSTIVNLPVNLNGVSVLVPVAIAPQLDPETTEIDNLSFIVTGTPADMIMRNCLPSYCWTILPFPRPPPPDFALFSYSAAGGSLTLPLPPPGSTISNTVTTTKVVQSYNGYTGAVTLTAVAPPDLLVSFAPVSQLVPPGGTVLYTETISTTPLTIPGPHLVWNVASDGILFHSFPIIVNVV